MKRQKTNGMHPDVKKSYDMKMQMMAKFQRIADTVNHDLNIRGALVTAEQVACVAVGTESTESHPTIQAIMVELRRHRIPIAPPMAIDSGFD